MASAIRAIAARKFMKLFYARSNFLFCGAEVAVFRHAARRLGGSPGCKKQGLGNREQGVERQAPKAKAKAITGPSTRPGAPGLAEDDRLLRAGLEARTTAGQETGGTHASGPAVRAVV